MSNKCVKINLKLVFSKQKNIFPTKAVSVMIKAIEMHINSQCIWKMYVDRSMTKISKNNSYRQKRI